MMRCLFLILPCFFLFACSNTPEEMIIGTWNFEALHVDQTMTDYYGKEYFDQLDSSMQNIVMEFGEDGTYRSRYLDQAGEVTGTYTYNGDGTFTIHTGVGSSGEEAKVTRLDDHEMVVQSEGWAYLLIR